MLDPSILALSPGAGGSLNGEMSAAAHDHAGHSHAVTPTTDARRLAVALGLIAGFMAVEVVAGILAHSLALVSDAAHMLTDAFALGLSLAVIRLVARPSGGNLTFGLKRAEILSAQANGFTLLVLGALIVYEGVERLVSPPKPAGAVMLAVALAGVVVNLLATRQLARANRGSMNVEGSFQHLLTDLAAFVIRALRLASVSAGFAFTARRWLGRDWILFIRFGCAGRRLPRRPRRLGIGLRLCCVFRGRGGMRIRSRGFRVARFRVAMGVMFGFSRKSRLGALGSRFGILVH